MDKKTLLEWYIEAGVDETIGEKPVDCYALSIKPAKPDIRSEPIAGPFPPAQKSFLSPLHHSPSAAATLARELANQAKNIAELEQTVREFEGCSLKKTASKTVFSDGNPQAKIMIIGEAPGANEDKQGIPFCGVSGMLLDRMLAAIGLDRTSVYISNTVFWRPPGNRQPSKEETSICLPFVEKHIALINPALLLLSGGTATTTLLEKDQSISRLRGKFYEYENMYLPSSIPAAVTYHPSYLLRSPLQKRLAWQDMLVIKKFLIEKQVL